MIARSIGGLLSQDYPGAFRVILVDDQSADGTAEAARLAAQALGARLKAQGPIWLGLTTRAESIRPYVSLGEIGRMISRSAYAQLGYSPWLLIGCVAGMVLTYLAPPALAAFGHGPARWAGALAWLLMAAAFQPMLRFYRRSPLWGLALPAIGALYTLFTLQSAVQVWRGKGGMWKGRSQAPARPGRPQAGSDAP